jgi:hypothetical protein
LEPPPPEAAGEIEVGDGKATSCGPEPQPVPPPASLTASAVPTYEPELPSAPPLSTSTGAAVACGTKPRPAPPPAAPTAAAIRGPELPPAQPSSALTGAVATYGPPPQPAPLPAPSTAGATTFCGIEIPPPPSCAPKANVAAFNPDWIGNGSTDTQFFRSDHESLFPARLGSALQAWLAAAQLQSFGFVPSRNNLHRWVHITTARAGHSIDDYAARRS